MQRIPAAARLAGYETVALMLLLTGGVAAPAAAQNVDTSDWVCEFCPFERGYRAEVDVGATDVDSPSAYFGNYTGYDEDGVYANVDGTGLYSAEGYRLEYTLEDLGLDSRFAELRGSMPGTLDYNLSWRQIPRREFVTTSAIFVPGGGSELLLPDPWTRASTTGGFADLGPSLTRETIESDRSILDLGGRYRVSDRFSLSADYRQQTRDGNNILGGSYYTNASLLPMPFDYTTDEVDLGARYAGGNFVLAAAWYLSDFESDGDAFGWESPFLTAPGAAFGALAQPPDNRFQQLSLSGSYAWPAARTYLSASASIGRIEQDEALLPYTTNANLAAGAPPTGDLGGEVDTTSYALSLTSDPFDRARVRISYRYDERDNSTPQEVYLRVITDTFLSNEPETSIPYSYERSTLAVSGDYRLLDSLKLSAGYDRRDIERDFQEVGEQTEDSGWGRVRWQPNAVIELDVKGGAAKRDIDSYNEAFAVTLGQNPLMRKYNLAYRYREFGEFTLGIAPPDSRLSLTLTGTYADDSYTESRLGLISAEDTGITADLGLSLSETASLYVTGGYQDIQSIQVGAEMSGAADWRATNDDAFATYGFGFRMREIMGNLDLELDYTNSDGSSEIIVSSGDGTGFERFPDLENELDYLRVKLGWQWSERLRITGIVRFQRFEAEDWALEGVEPATVPLLLSLGADPYGDEVVSVGLGFNYAVGNAGGQGGE